MTYGILTEQTSRKFFEIINNRPYCSQCYAQRIHFLKYDKKHNDCYSDLFPGFSSEIVQIPIDILIVAEAHGGGRKENFRPQLDLESEIAGLAEYYLSERLKKFHQKEMRKLLSTLNDNRKTWVFTDLIKCFVWSRDKKNNLRGSDNKDLAIQNCRIYLDEQIEILRPKKVLSLGKTVTEQYFKLLDKFEHGSVHEWRIKNHTFNMVFSIFPSRNTADLWVANEEWKKILPKLI